MLRSRIRGAALRLGGFVYYHGGGIQLGLRDLMTFCVVDVDEYIGSARFACFVLLRKRVQRC